MTDCERSEEEWWQQDKTGRFLKLWMQSSRERVRYHISVFCSLNSIPFTQSKHAQTKELKIIVLTTSFGLLLAGTTPAKHRQRDRESINDLWCSSLVPSDQKLSRTNEWTLLQSRMQLALALSPPPPPPSLLLLSLRATHCARLRVNLSDVLPVCCIPLHSALSPVLLEEEQVIYLY